LNGLERGVLGGAGEQEVLRPDVPVHDPHGVADVHDGEDVPARALRHGRDLGAFQSVLKYQKKVPLNVFRAI
jgi:hypothetical protein